MRRKVRPSPSNCQPLRQMSAVSPETKSEGGLTQVNGSLGAGLDPLGLLSCLGDPNHHP
jgi:hypothetical protein